MPQISLTATAVAYLGTDVSAQRLAIAWPLGLESAWEFCALAAAASARRIGPAPVTWWDLESLDSRQPRNVANAA